MIEDIILPSSAWSSETPMVTNERGGKQSAIPVRADLLPARALLDVSRILHQGAEKYGENNWKNIEVESHLNHALTHLFGVLEGDTQDEHLVHAATRILFALQLQLEKDG